MTAAHANLLRHVMTAIAKSIALGDILLLWRCTDTLAKTEVPFSFFVVLVGYSIIYFLHSLLRTILLHQCIFLALNRRYSDSLVSELVLYLSVEMFFTAFCLPLINMFAFFVAALCVSWSSFLQEGPENLGTFKYVSIFDIMFYRFFTGVPASVQSRSTAIPSPALAAVLDRCLQRLFARFGWIDVDDLQSKNVASFHFLMLKV